MKILIPVSTLIILLLVAACAGPVERIPKPDLPLDEATIAAALDAVGLDWNIQEIDDGWVGEDRRTFALYTDTVNFPSAWVISGTQGEERLVTIQAIGGNQYALPEELWESVIGLAVHLFGGFTSVGQVYDVFQTQFGVENTEGLPIVYRGSGERNIEIGETQTWRTQVDETYCSIVIGRQEGWEREYLLMITLTSDPTVFGFTGW